MPTTPEKNKETVKRFFLASNNDELQELDQLMVENFVTHGPQSLLPRAVGLEAHKQGIGGFKKNFPDATIEITHILAQGDRVMTRQTVTATHVNEFMGAQPTNKRITWTANQLVRFDDDGKMIERWVLEDFASMFQQLGILPATFG
jgi:predicted ester cyclase